MIRVLILLLLAVPVWADNFDTTWAGTEWNSVWTDVANSGACDTTNSFAYIATGGNPTYSRRLVCAGRNDVTSRHSEWTGTWESLGVTAGWTVSTVEMLGLDTELQVDTNCDTVTFGPLELRDSANALVATLWAGRTRTTVETSFVNEGADPAQDVGGLGPSNSSIELWMNGSADLANTVGSNCTAVFDNLAIRVVATLATRKRVYIIGFSDDKVRLIGVQDI